MKNSLKNLDEIVEIALSTKGQAAVERFVHCFFFFPTSFLFTTKLTKQIWLIQGAHGTWGMASSSNTHRVKTRTGTFDALASSMASRKQIWSHATSHSKLCTNFFYLKCTSFNFLEALCCLRLMVTKYFLLLQGWIQKTLRGKSWRWHSAYQCKR